MAILKEIGKLFSTQNKKNKRSELLKYPMDYSKEVNEYIKSNFSNEKIFFNEKCIILKTVNRSSKRFFNNRVVTFLIITNKRVVCFYYKIKIRKENINISFDKYFSIHLIRDIKTFSRKGRFENIRIVSGKRSYLIGFHSKIEKNKFLDSFKIAREPIERKEIETGLSNNFANLTPYEFEEFIAKLFTKMGYKTSITKKGGDYGIDVIAKDKSNTIAIQVKKFEENNNVGNRDVQRVLGSINYFKANKSMIVTTSDFTFHAREQAKNSPIELWDKKILHRNVRRYFIGK